MNNALKVGMALGLAAGMAGSAFALDCSDPNSVSSAYIHPECNVAATGKVVAAAPITQMTAISQAIEQRIGLGLGGGPLQLAQGVKGMSAGANAAKWNAWASGSHNETELSKGSGNPLDFDGRQTVFTVGGDYRLSPAATLGASLAYDDGSIKPSTAGGLKIINRGYNVAPYLAYQLGKNYSVDAIAGLGWGELRRTGGADYKGDTERRFAGVNLNSGHWFGNMQFAGKASLFYSHQKNDADAANGLNEATKYLLQGRLGVQASYWVGNGFVPYASLAYVNDMARNRTFGAALDRDGFVAGIGVNYFSRGGVTAGASYTSEFGRTDVTNNVLMANLNVRF